MKGFFLVGLSLIVTVGVVLGLAFGLSGHPGTGRTASSSPDPSEMTTAQIQAWGKNALDTITSCQSLLINVSGAVQMAESTTGLLDPSYGKGWDRNCGPGLLGSAPTDSDKPQAIKDVLAMWGHVQTEGGLIHRFYTTPMAGWDDLRYKLNDQVQAIGKLDGNLTGQSQGAGQQ